MEPKHSDMWFRLPSSTGASQAFCDTFDVASSVFAKELAHVRSKCEQVNDELINAQKQIVSLRRDKEMSEQGLRKLLDEVQKTKEEIEMNTNQKIKMLENDKFMNDIEHNKQLELLQNKLESLQVREKTAKDSELSIKHDMETLRQHVCTAHRSSDLPILKQQVTKLSDQQLEKNISMAVTEIQLLKSMIEKAIYITS